MAVGLNRVIFEARLAEQQQKTPHGVQTLLALGGDMLGPAEDPGKDGGDGGRWRGAPKISRRELEAERVIFKKEAG